MRIVATIAMAAFIVAAASAQVWDKPIAPGLTFHMEYAAPTPRAIFAIRYSPSSASVHASPELAQGKVYADDDSKGRETVSQMVSRTGALGGINGDFFPFTGDPLGLMVRNGQLLSVPVKPRAAFGWGNGAIGVGVINWHITLTADGMAPLDVDGVDQSCAPNSCVINDPQAGLALSSKPATCVVVKPDGQPMLGPDGQFTGVVQSVFSGSTSVPLGTDALLIMGEGDKSAYLGGLQPGQKITFDVHNEGLDWTKINNAIGGGPLLVQGGHPFVDWQDEGFKPDFAQQRHPRSAVGRTAAGDMWFVAVDGRQAESAGATLDEMATIMVNLGCTDAINLDGGGSTDISLFGMVLNRPVEKQTDQEAVVTERKVANGVLFFGEAPAPDGSTMKIVVPDKVLATDTVDLTVTKDDGTVVPNNDIIWAASGTAFIDQGGRLHIIGPGTAAVQAHVHGTILSAPITIDPAPAVGAPPVAPIKPPKNTPPSKTGKGGKLNA
jgi:hypothetical protein